MNPYTAATQDEWLTLVRQAAVDEMTGQTGFTPDRLTVTASTTVQSGGLWYVQVKASYPFRTIIAWPGLPSSVTLQRMIVLRGIR